MRQLPCVSGAGTEAAGGEIGRMETIRSSYQVYAVGSSRVTSLPVMYVSSVRVS